MEMNISAIASQQRLAGKVAIITEGTSAIGASTVKLFHQNGAKVVIADTQDDLGQAIANKLGQNVLYIHCDMTNEDQIKALVDKTIAKYGKLDIMISNTRIMDHKFGNILDCEKSELNSCVSDNLVGAFLGAKQAARVMVSRGKGCILLTSCTCAKIDGLLSHSCAIAKYAIMGLAKNLAAEMGKFGIKVNCISPSGFLTSLGFVQEVEMCEEKAEFGDCNGKILKWENVANAALYLASDEANYVSGIKLVMDGGFSVMN